ncbi:hypothetical protein HYU06_01440 [Candidatus Woesearchaeota archaeon]|nr:hypothetical protein [Candidatus Woesearchaeota archaeon]
MGEEHKDAHGAEYGKECHGKSSDGSGLEQMVASTIAASSGAGIAYLAFSPLIAAPIILGGAFGLGLYYGAKYLYNSIALGSKDKAYGDAHAEPAHAGAHGGGH